jgi:hypothetical protein
VARDDATAARLEAAGKAAFAAQEVVDAYLVMWTSRPDGRAGAAPFPRAVQAFWGPSTRPDLGKQAEFGTHAPLQP